MAEPVIKMAPASSIAMLRYKMYEVISNYGILTETTLFKILARKYGATPTDCLIAMYDLQKEKLIEITDGFWDKPKNGAGGVHEQR